VGLKTGQNIPHQLLSTISGTTE